MPPTTRGSRTASPAPSAASSLNLSEGAVSALIATKILERKARFDAEASRDVTEKRLQQYSQELEVIRNEAGQHRDTLQTASKDLAARLEAVQSSLAKYQAQTDLELSQLDQRLDDEVARVEKQISSLSRNLNADHETLRSEIESFSGRLQQPTEDPSSTSLTALSDKLAGLSVRLDTESSRVHSLAEDVGCSRQSLEVVTADLTRAVAAAQANSTTALERLSQQLTDELAQLDKSVAAQEQKSASFTPEMCMFVAELFARKDEILSLLNRSETYPSPCPDILDVAEGATRLLDASSSTASDPGEEDKNCEGAIESPNTSPFPETSQQHDHRSPGTGKSLISARFMAVGELLQKHNTSYRSDAPKSEVVFVWNFLRSITDIPWMRFIQKTLLEDHPDLVYRAKKAGRAAHDVSLRNGFTWAKLCESMAKIDMNNIPEHLR